MPIRCYQSVETIVRANDISCSNVDGLLWITVLTDLRGGMIAVDMKEYLVMDVNLVSTGAGPSAHR